MRQFSLILLATSLTVSCTPTQRTPMEEAKHLYSFGRFEEAIESCQAAMSKADTEKEKSEVHALIGRCHLEVACRLESEGDQAAKSHFDDAITQFTLSIEQFDNYEARHSRRIAYRSIGKTELAAEDYLRARELDPDYASAYLNTKPDEIRDYSDLEIKSREEAAAPQRDEPDEVEFDDEIVSRPGTLAGDRSEAQPVAGFLPRTNLPPKNQAAGFNGESPAEEPKIGGQFSDWLTQHNQRVALPERSRNRYQVERSPLLDDPDKDTDETTGEEVERDTTSEERLTGWPPSSNAPLTRSPDDPGSLPSTGIPTTGYPTSPRLPTSGIPSTGIGGTSTWPTTGGGFAGILPTAPTTGIGSAPIAFPSTQPPSSTVPTGLLRPTPTFQHGVSLPLRRGDSRSLPRTPSAGVPPELAPAAPAPTTGLAPNTRLGPVQFQTSPLSQPRPGAPVPNTLRPPNNVVPAQR